MNPRKPDHRRRLTDEQEQVVVQEYLSGRTTKAIGESLGYTSSGIWNLLRTLGIPRRTTGESVKLSIAKNGAFTRNRQYNHDLNRNYFDVIDTPEKARWLGLLAADGCISCVGNHKTMIVQLQDGDRGHLEALATALGYTGPIAFVKAKQSSCKPQARLAVSCTPLCDALIRHGVTPRKSLTLQPWTGDFQRHWWAGLFDGDGSLSKSSRRNDWSATLVSASKPIIDAWATFIETHTGNRKTPYVNRGTWQTTYSGLNTPQSIARLLYTNLEGSVSLARKQAVADSILSVTPSRPYIRQTRWIATLPQIESLFAQFGDWNKVAEHFGCPRVKLMRRREYLINHR